MELVGVADHEVVTMEGAMAMLGGVGDITIRAVPPSKRAGFSLYLLELT